MKEDTALFNIDNVDKELAKKTIDEEIKVVAVEKYDPNACTNLAESCEDFF